MASWPSIVQRDRPPRDTVERDDRVQRGPRRAQLLDRRGGRPTAGPRRHRPQLRACLLRAAAGRHCRDLCPRPPASAGPLASACCGVSRGRSGTTSSRVPCRHPSTDRASSRSRPGGRQRPHAGGHQWPDLHPRQHRPAWRHPDRRQPADRPRQPGRQHDQRLVPGCCVDSSIRHNTFSTKTAGIQVDTTSSGDSLRSNTFTGNGGTCSDSSSGVGTAGTDNHWSGNTASQGSSPAESAPSPHRADSRFEVGGTPVVDPPGSFSVPDRSARPPARRAGDVDAASPPGTGGRPRVARPDLDERRVDRVAGPGDGHGQRGWKGQPGGAAMTLGGSPPTTGRMRRRLAGTRLRHGGQQRPRVGVQGWSTSSRAAASSTMRPAYITAMRSAKWRALARSWVMYRKETPLAPGGPEQPQDLGPAGGVDHGDRLVGHEVARLAGSWRGRC